MKEVKQCPRLWYMLGKKTEDRSPCLKIQKSVKILDCTRLSFLWLFPQVPPEMFFLFRMLGLIRGLCTTLEVKLPYLEIMSSYAQKGLVLDFDRKVGERE